MTKKEHPLQLTASSKEMSTNKATENPEEAKRRATKLTGLKNPTHEG